MTKTISLLVSLLISIHVAQASWDGKVFDGNQKKEIPRSNLLLKLASSQIVVIGEKHYTKAVQDEEGRIIFDVVTLAKKEQQFSLSWEFLNASAQPETENLYNQVLAKEMTSEDFLLKTQGGKNSLVYSPMITAAASLGGKLFGVNLSREEKAPVTKGGLSALDPKLLPPNFKMGGASYFERFNETMRDHATPDQIKNYFAAQSLVDDVSAYHLLSDSLDSLKFLVIGAFHSMYNDGVVARIKDRDSSISVSNVEIIDASDYTAAELPTILSDEKYGVRADFIIFVNEPSNDQAFKK